MLHKSNFTKQEINNILVQTNYFINNHLSNYNHALQIIICKDHVPQETIDDYKEFKNCTFKGYIDFLISHEKDADLDELIEAHDNFHYLTGEILAKYKDNQEISHELFNTLHLTHNKLIELLNTIILDLEVTKTQLDPLTSAWTRKIFLGFLDIEYQKVKREKKNFSLAYMDIDHFKIINDTYGHACGDFILTELVKLIRYHLRRYDSIARWGGEEFLILLPETSVNDSLEIIKRIKESIEKKAFIFEDNHIKITCSFGLTQSSNEIKLNELIKKSDALLYQAKSAGRNHIETA